MTDEEFEKLPGNIQTEFSHITESNRQKDILITQLRLERDFYKELHLKMIDLLVDRVNI